MTREQAITDAYFLATGKSVAIGSIPTAKRALLTSLAIKFYRDWQTEPDMEWDSLYTVAEAGTVTATDIFTVDTAFHKISTAEQKENNKVRVRYGDVANPQYAYFKTAKPPQLHMYSRNGTPAVARYSATQIQFATAFKSTDEVFGGTIEVPVVQKLPDIATDAAEVFIDDPNWLPARMAAQYVFSYKSLRDMYGDLLDQANELMTGMKLGNSTGNETSSTGVDYFGLMGNVGSTT